MGVARVDRGAAQRLAMQALLRISIVAALTTLSSLVSSQQLTTAGRPAELDIRISGEHSLRITLKPLGFADGFPFSPGVAVRSYPAPAISLRSLAHPVRK